MVRKKDRKKVMLQSLLMYLLQGHKCTRVYIYLNMEYKAQQTRMTKLHNKTLMPRLHLSLCKVQFIWDSLLYQRAHVFYIDQTIPKTARS